jgi:hypothetical protein
MSIPTSWAGPNGQFSGGFPVTGASVWCAMTQGGQWSVISYMKSDNTFDSSLSSNRRNIMASLLPGRWLTQVDNNIKIIADPNTGVTIGNAVQYIQIDPIQKIYSNTLSEHLSFSEANRKITGVVKRDIESDQNRNITGSALTSHTYALRPIGLDPTATTSISSSFRGNPSFTENRELVYEFDNSFGFTDDKTEVTLYDNPEIKVPTTLFFNRRDGRSDTLSLSLVAPNQLMESIKGTVVDANGNLIDLNRNILPSGKDSLSFQSSENNKSATFISLREQARKTIAYHFELNARKAKIPDNASIATPTDYARDRSRFSIDIDKEGQFKINVPSSSEIGNVPLLTRYENFSTLRSVATNGETDPNEFLRNPNNIDIYNESFGVGVIEITSKSDTLKSYASTNDRVTGTPIKLGTAYHDLQQTLQLHNRVNPVAWYTDSTLNNQDITPLPGNIVSPNIIVSGPDSGTDKPNAGGRSGTINLDGFLSISIGSSTVDRQSIWLDMAGGMVMNVGRDLSNRSLSGRFDGDILVQVGGETVANDSRFGSSNNAVRAGTVDIRVVAGAGPGAQGNMTIVRIDNTGVRISSAGGVDIVSHGLMRFKSIYNDIIFDAKSIYFYENGSGNGRLVMRNPKHVIT